MSLREQILAIQTPPMNIVARSGFFTGLSAAAELPGVLAAEQDAIDAARYRWLRAKKLCGSEIGIVAFPSWRLTEADGVELDAAIDAAMGERVKGEGE